MSANITCVALSGGIGGAKLALGLSHELDPAGLMVVANTGDDFEHLGLSISPDVDTLTYTLGGVANPETGWGRAGETWSFMEALAEVGGETWFNLGDKDLALHVERTRRLAAGEPLSAITTDLAARFGIVAAIAAWSKKHHGSPVRFLAIGPRTSLMALTAAALNPAAVEQVELRKSYGSLKEIIEQDLGVNDAPELFCFGLLEQFDVLQLAALAAPTSVMFTEASDRVKTEIASLKSFYSLLDVNVDPLK